MTWTQEQLSRIGDSPELQLAARRDDGTIGRHTTMWVVRVGDDLYVRSAGGPTRPWYRHARASGSGHVRVGDVASDVSFDDPPDDQQAAIDSAYHDKYDRYGPGPVRHVTGADAWPVTIRLTRSEP
jgi:hypothetical protein